MQTASIFFLSSQALRFCGSTSATTIPLVQLLFWQRTRSKDFVDLPRLLKFMMGQNHTEIHADTIFDTVHRNTTSLAALKHWSKTCIIRNACGGWTNFLCAKGKLQSNHDFIEFFTFPSDGQAANQPCHKPVALLSLHLPRSGQLECLVLDKYSYIHIQRCHNKINTNPRILYSYKVF